MNENTTFRLPEHWAPPASVSDTVSADGVVIHRSGFSTTSSAGHEICGAAADWRVEVSSRAWFELLERVGSDEAFQNKDGSYPERLADGTPTGRSLSTAELFVESDAPAQWRYARSNGIAVHRGWGAACQRALWELAERDRVVRAWHGELHAEMLPAESIRMPSGISRSYDWRLYAFPERERESFSAGFHVVGLFGFPLAKDRPFVLGMAGRPHSGDAVEAATAEAIQQLAFLWGEEASEIVSKVPGPMQHLETYQLRGAHERVRKWLEDGHGQHARPRPRKSTVVTYVDLTPCWFDCDLRLVKAICADAVPLVFGDSPLSAHLPDSIRLHPIA